MEKIFSVKPKTKQQRAVLIASEKLEHERKSHRKSLVSNLDNEDQEMFHNLAKTFRLKVKKLRKYKL